MGIKLQEYADKAKIDNPEVLKNEYESIKAKSKENKSEFLYRALKESLKFEETEEDKHDFFIRQEETKENKHDFYDGKYMFKKIKKLLEETMYKTESPPSKFLGKGGLSYEQALDKLSEFMDNLRAYAYRYGYQQQFDIMILDLSIENLQDQNNLNLTIENLEDLYNQKQIINDIATIIAFDNRQNHLLSDSNSSSKQAIVTIFRTAADAADAADADPTEPPAKKQKI